MVKNKHTDTDKDEVIHKYYYERGYQVGIKKLYEVLKREQAEYKISYRYVKSWLDKQVPYQINQLTRQTVHIKPIQSKRKLALIQIDLLDYSQNAAPNSYKYILNIIDVWSRKCWLIRLKNKKASTIKDELEIWMTDNYDEDNPYRVLQSDDGGEFKDLSPLFEKYNIRHSISSRPQANGIVERCNQTIRRLLAKNVIQKNANSRWGLVDLVEKNYNNTYHSGIKSTPNERFNLKSKKALEKIAKEDNKIASKVITKRNPVINSSIELEPNDWVRIKRVKKNPLDKTKGFNNWSADIYAVNRTVRAIKRGMQGRYELRRLDGSVLRKRFYRDDLLKISNSTTGDNQLLGTVDDNPDGITEEEIVFEVKPEYEPEPVQVDKPEVAKEEIKIQKKKRVKLVVPAREKSTRTRKVPDRLDL